MKSTVAHYEKIISDLLWYGTWAAVIAIALGLLIGIEGVLGLTIAKTGIALFILLPISRVALLLVMFLKEKDRVYVAISAAVLAIIAISVVVGFYRVTIHL